MSLRVEDSRKLLVKIVGTGTSFSVEDLSQKFRAFLQGRIKPYLARIMREIQGNHHYRYGSPRVKETLRRDYGKRISRKKVAMAASLPLAGGKRLKRPAAAEVHPNYELKPQTSGL